ncbi:metallophosphoesterase, partial [Candidatus Bathyarchaeota archaeon]|nr:metallophosphoesterase [Candidatus Bathyarchaeota archaeon]
IDSFRTAVKEINSLSPDLIVVTGDLTEEGVRAQFQQAERELKGLRAERVIYISGNHDYRSTGYLLFREFFSFNQVTEIGDAVIVVLSSARPDRDDGEVGHRQNIWLEETLAKYRGWMKVVAIHHHIIPVPDT